MARKGKPKVPRRPLGRPSMGVERYNVTLTPEVAEHYRKIGDGNLSAGISKAAEKAAGK